MDARLIGRMKVGFMLSARAFGTTIKTHFSMSGSTTHWHPAT